MPGAGVEELDAFHVVRGEGEVVRAIENPTVDDLKRTEELLGPNESLVTPDRQCLTYCAEDCGAVCDIEDQCLFECSCGLGCRWCC